MAEYLSGFGVCDVMRRREFILAFGGVAAWHLATPAQAAKLPTIGFLGPLTQSAQSEWTAAFVQRMREHGWIDGRTIAIEYRWGEGRSGRLAEIAAELVRLKVDIIVTGGTAAVIAAKQATSVIPIVFGVAGDPVGTGLVASLARPGGNVTGLSNQSTDLAGKRLELLRDVVPGLRRLAIMANVSSPIGVLETGEVQAAAGKLGIEAVSLEIRRMEDSARHRGAQGSRRCTFCRDRPAHEHQPDPNQHPGAGRTTAVDARGAGLCRSRRADVLWAKLRGPIPARRGLC